MYSLFISAIIPILLWTSIIPFSQIFGISPFLVSAIQLFISFACLIFSPIKLSLSSIGILKVILTIFFFFIVLFNNISNDFYELFNPILITLLILLYGSFSNGLKNSRNLLFIKRLQINFLIIFCIIQSFLVADYILNSDVSMRYKGFGSGTIFGFQAVIAWALSLKLIKDNHISRLLFIYTLFIVVISLLATQGRGNIIAFFIATIPFLFLSKHKFKLITFGVVFVGLILTFFDQLFLQVFERMLLQPGNDLEQFTSGRLQTQVYLYNWILTAPLHDIFFGVGLGELKLLVKLGFEYPHFDLFSIFYETGFLGVLFFIFLAFLFIKNIDYKIFILVYLFSGLHTNMFLYPQFLIIIIFLSQATGFNADFKRKYII